MESRIVNKGNRVVLEIELDSTGIDRQAAAAACLASHGLKPGNCEIVFTNPSTREA